VDLHALTLYETLANSREVQKDLLFLPKANAKHRLETSHGSETAWKVAVLTGASVGIGLAVAEGFAAEGVNLVLAARQRERLEQVAADIEKRHGVRVVPAACDVATAEGVDALVAAANQHFNGADILFNNAGTGSNETIMDAPDGKWQAYWDLHVMAAVRLARGLVPSMKRRGGGAILHNASICATQPLGYEPIYNVTKAALMMFSKNLANEVVKDCRHRPGAQHLKKQKLKNNSQHFMNVSEAPFS
jgi:short-subunit dehydrogenase